MKIIWIANEKQYNILLPISKRASEVGIDFKVIATERISNGFGQDIQAMEIHKYLLEKAIDSLIFEDAKTAMQWLISESPDYIFTSTPYDLYLPLEMHSQNLARVSTLCYVNYGFPMSEENIAWAKSNPFMANVTMQFDPTWSSSSPPYVIPVGSLKLESLRWLPSEEVANKRNDIPQIGWRPRWTLDADSTFWSYLETISDFVREHNAHLHFFVHPLIFRKLEQAGKPGKQAISTLKNLEIEGRLIWVPEDSYIENLSGLQVLIADAGSGLPEAAGLAVPIVFTGNTSDLNSTGRSIISSGISVSTQQELKAKLEFHLLGSTFPTPINPFFTPPGNQATSQYLFEVLFKYMNARKFKLPGGISRFWKSHRYNSR